MTLEAILPTILAAQDAGLTLEGGLIMAGCVTLVMGLNILCLFRILREPHPQEHHHALLDIDTHDVE